MPESPIRTALLGNGFARTVMLPCLRHVPEIKVVGIASPNLERARATAQEFAIEHVAADHRELLKSAEPELVFVVTPPHRHLEMTRDALAAGCHMVCEKPTALSAEESAAMVAAAEAAPAPRRGGKRPLALIDHELRFDPRRIALRKLIQEGRLGDILHASYTLHTPGRHDPAGPWTWWSDAAQGGGMWGAVGSHAIDALRVLLGEVRAVRGRLATFVKERTDHSGTRRPVTSDDYATAWLELQSGAAAAILCSAVESERRHDVLITGSRGFARLAEQQPLLVRESKSDWREAANDRDLPPSAELQIPDTDWARCFIRYSRAIVDAIRAGKDHLEGAAGFRDGHRNQQVLDAVRASATRKEDWAQVG